MSPESIRSSSNSLLKEIRRAIARGEATEGGFAVAETYHLLEEALRSEAGIGAVVFAERARARIESLPPMPGARLIEVPDAIFDSLSATEAPQGVLSLVRIPVAAWERIFHYPALVVVLDGIQDPGNAGAIARAAEAFGASGLVFLKGTVSPYNTKCLRAAAGSLFRVPLLAPVAHAELLGQIEAHGAARWITMPRDGAPVTSAPLDEPCAIVVGNEGRGVSEAMAAGAQSLTIPTCGVESLNASIAASIVLYEAFRQRMES